MSEFIFVEETYRLASSPIDKISELVKELNQWYQANTEHNYLIPCVIAGKAALVCKQGLSDIDSLAFLDLSKIATKYGLYLKEESRTQDINPEGDNRRKNASIALIFCLELMLSSKMVMASDLQNQFAFGFVTADLSMQGNIAINLAGEKVIHLGHTPLPTEEQIVASYIKQKAAMKVNQHAEREIHSFLSAAYAPEAGDPANILSDIVEISKYYAQYPQAIKLIELLQTKKVVLKYKSGSWEAQAWGSKFGISSVIIFFDTRVGAQLINYTDCHESPACDISPADALLHELLHARSMLLDSQHFIDTGGMELTLYPFENEREVIASENQLYDSMNLQDGLSRPLRNRHSGQLFRVGCTLCLPTAIFAAK